MWSSGFRGARRTANYVGQEVGVLHAVADGPLATVVHTPRVLHEGSPTSEFAHPWTVLGWLDGTDAWTERASLDDTSEDLAIDLAETIRIIGGLTQVPAPTPRAG